MSKKSKGHKGLVKKDDCLERKVRRGDIYYADLEVGVGSEQHGFRPVLVIQNNIGNMFSPTTIVAALTSKVIKKDRLPTHVELGDRFGLPQDSFVMMEQLFTLDKQRLGEYIGTISDEPTLTALEKAIVVSLELREYENVHHSRLCTRYI